MTPLPPTHPPAVLKGPGVLHSSLAPIEKEGPGVWRPLALRMGEGELPSAWGCRAVWGGHRLPGRGAQAGDSIQSHLPQAYRLVLFNQGWFSQPCPEPRLAVPGVTEHLRPDGLGEGVGTLSPRTRGLRTQDVDKPLPLPTALISGGGGMWSEEVWVGPLGDPGQNVRIFPIE